MKICIIVIYGQIVKMRITGRFKHIMHYGYIKEMKYYVDIIVFHFYGTQWLLAILWRLTTTRFRATESDYNCLVTINEDDQVYEESRPPKPTSSPINIIESLAKELVFLVYPIPHKLDGICLVTVIKLLLYLPKDSFFLFSLELITHSDSKFRCSM